MMMVIAPNSRGHKGEKGSMEEFERMRRGMEHVLLENCETQFSLTKFASTVRELECNHS